MVGLNLLAFFICEIQNIGKCFILGVLKTEFLYFCGREEYPLEISQLIVKLEAPPYKIVEMTAENEASPPCLMYY